MDTPSGQIVTEPVAPYPGWIGSDTPGNQYGFFSIEYMQSAEANKKYPGELYHVQDDIPGKTREQVVEAAYLSDRLYQLGGMNADLNLYQGPISFAIWQIMDPSPGHVPRNPAAQQYIQEAQYMYQTGRISAVYYPNTLIIVSHSPNVDDYMTMSAAVVPEPGTAVLFLAGFGLVGIGLSRRRRKPVSSPPTPSRSRIYGGLVALCFCLLPASLGATTVTFGLLGDPGHSYSFARTDSPPGQIVTEPVAPYPGWIGTNEPGNQYGFFSIDYLKTANWNTTYSGTLYHVQDDIPGKTREQIVEAAYLSDRLYHMGGMAADLNLHQGPISFAVWQIMDPAPGHVQRDAAAQPYVQEAQYMYHTGQISASHYQNTLIFVPDNGAIQDFMSVAAASVPEPGTIVLFVAGLGLIGVGLIKRRRDEA